MHSVSERFLSFTGRSFPAGIRDGGCKGATPYIPIRNPFCAGDGGDDAKRSDRDCEAILLAALFGGLLASTLRIGMGLATPYGQRLVLVAALSQSHARVHGIGPNLLGEFNW